MGYGRRKELGSIKAIPLPRAEARDCLGTLDRGEWEERELDYCAALRCSASNYGPTTDNGAAANHCAATISDRSATNYGGAAITNRPARSDATSTVYTTRANDCAGFYRARNDKRSDKAEDYDRVLHALSLPADFREGFAFPSH
jgi:hypothetical protein